MEGGCLTSLLLTGNSLRSFPALESLAQLKELDLSNNLITEGVWVWLRVSQSRACVNWESRGKSAMTRNCPCTFLRAIAHSMTAE